MRMCSAPYALARSSRWLKITHAQTDEFVIVDSAAPKRSRSAFGSLLLASRSQRTLQYVGRVGRSFDDAQLASLGRRLELLRQPKGSVQLPDHVRFSTRSVSWVEPRRAVKGAFRGRGKEGLLRQSGFERMREDKNVNDIDEAATPVATRLSSPDKLMYPQSDISKGDVADYYRAVAAHMLPELIRRPLSLLRCPGGIENACFFQRHQPDSLGAGVHAVAITDREEKADDYLYIEDVDGLLDLVQMNTLEFHPWGATVKDLEHPDRLVFDLDPGDGVGWPAVIEAAREIRDRLGEVGLQSFVRLTGGKGVHVVVPIQPGPTWSEAKGFCEAFAVALATQSPERYVATAAKAKRTGVIFIDWLRNARGATSVANWSLRARRRCGGTAAGVGRTRAQP